jgi:hypothetical protein
MGEYSKSELLTLSLIADNVVQSVESILYNIWDKDKLAYAACLNDKEKTKYTKQEIKKLQKDFQNCDSSIAPFVSALITDELKEIGSFDEKQKIIIRNYISTEFHELLETINENETFKEDDEIEFRDYIIQYEYETELFDEFIIIFSKAVRYSILASFLTHKKDLSNAVLSALEKDISLIISSTEAITLDVVKLQVEPLINSSKDLDVIDKAVKSVLDQTYKKFRKLGDSLYNNLDKLKALSQENYLIGFASVYVKLYNFSIKDNLNDHEDSLNYFHDKRYTEPSFYCILRIKSMIYNSVLKVILEELLINRLTDYDAAFKLPTSFNDTIEYINKGFYELESMMEGKIIKMKYFNIPRAIEKFNSLRNKYENKPKESLLLLDKYFDISQQIYNQIDQGEFDNDDAFEDEIFMKTWNELSFFYDNMQSLFTQAEIDYLAPTGATKVLDILNPLNVPQAEPVQVIKTKKETSIHIAFNYIKKGASFKNNLTEFRRCLIDGGFIDKLTKLADFNKIFKNELPDTPIIWSGNLSELYYLIKTLHNDKKLIDNTGKEVWKITANCFVDSNSNQFDWAKFRGQKPPASSKKLDKIISVL